jgi:hypothetical protein
VLDFHVLLEAAFRGEKLLAQFTIKRRIIEGIIAVVFRFSTSFTWHFMRSNVTIEIAF